MKDGQEIKAWATANIKLDIFNDYIGVEVFVSQPNVVVVLEDKHKGVKVIGVARWSSEDRALAAKMERDLEILAKLPTSSRLDLELQRGALGSKLYNLLEKVAWNRNKGVKLAFDRAVRAMRDYRLGVLVISDETGLVRGLLP